MVRTDRTSSHLFGAFDELFSPARHTTTVELQSHQNKGPVTPVPDGLDSMSFVTRSQDGRIVRVHLDAAVATGNVPSDGAVPPPDEARLSQPLYKDHAQPAGEEVDDDGRLHRGGIRTRFAACSPAGESLASGGPLIGVAARIAA